MNVITIIIEKVSKDHYSAYAPDVEGITGGGETIELAKESIKKCIDLLKEVRKHEHLPQQLKHPFLLVHRIHKDRIIDFGDTEQMAKDAWLFLTDNPKAKMAIITKRSFLVEIKIILDLVAAFQQERAMQLLPIKAPDKFKQILKLAKPKTKLADTSEAVPDENLPVAEKLELLKMIPIMQNERWQRIKRFQNMQNIQLNVRHFYMKQDIMAIRKDAERFETIKASLFWNYKPKRNR